jgi:hypothetical protein
LALGSVSQSLVWLAIRTNARIGKSVKGSGTKGDRHTVPHDTLSLALRGAHNEIR